jgi:hypothetical protein
MANPLSPAVKSIAGRRDAASISGTFATSRHDAPSYYRVVKANRLAWPFDRDYHVTFDAFGQPIRIAAGGVVEIIQGDGYVGRKTCRVDCRPIATRRSR